MRIVVVAYMSLDGVVQAPNRPEEDTDGGFAHGGWSPVSPAESFSLSVVSTRKIVPPPAGTTPTWLGRVGWAGSS